MRDFIYFICATATEGPRREAHSLADFEFVVLHKATSVLFGALRRALAVHRRNFSDGLVQTTLYHELPHGAILCPPTKFWRTHYGFGGICRSALAANSSQ